MSNNIKSLADQLRSKMAAPDIPENTKEPVKAATAKGKSLKAGPEDPQTEIQILQRITEYDNSNHKSLVHVRVDEKTALLLNHFKMATGVEITKLISFSIDHMFNSNPELKSIIKQFIKKIEL